VKAVVPPLEIGVEDNLGVAVCQEAPSTPLELSAQGPMVVDLAVEDDGARTILAVHRLVTMIQIDDAQTSCAERNVRGRKSCLTVRAPVNQVAEAGGEYIRRKRPKTVGEADNAAHVRSPWNLEGFQWSMPTLRRTHPLQFPAELRQIGSVHGFGLKDRLFISEIVNLCDEKSV
jgi:hypothetical protein